MASYVSTRCLWVFFSAFHSDNLDTATVQADGQPEGQLHEIDQQKVASCMFMPDILH